MTTFFVSLRFLPAVLALLAIGFVPRAQAAGGSARVLKGVVNLNAATADELSRLPGIGPSKAQAIVAYRKAHAFKSPQEIVRVKGIGRGTYARLKDHLTIQGPSTLSIEKGAPPAAPKPTAPKAAGPSAAASSAPTMKK